MDYPIKTNAPEQGRIDINDAHEVNYWTEKLDITKVKLKAAINAVGPVVKEVVAYLKKK